MLSLRPTQSEPYFMQARPEGLALSGLTCHSFDIPGPAPAHGPSSPPPI